MLAKNTFKRAKTIRHPNFLKFIDGLEVSLIDFFFFFKKKTFLRSKSFINVIPNLIFILDRKHDCDCH